MVKVNAVSQLRAELDPRRWAGELIAMGTNTDPYQRAEGKYRLTRGIVEVLAEVANPFSILTKSTLVLRDLALLAEAARRTSVRVNLSIGTLDEDVWRATEPGTPHPARRVRAVEALNAAGVPCGVLVAPVLPGLSDGPDQLEAVVRACVEAGPARSRRCCCTCGRASARCSSPGWPRPTPTWWPTTGAATATGPTPPGRPARPWPPSVALVHRHGGTPAERTTRAPGRPGRRPRSTRPGGPPRRTPTAAPLPPRRRRSSRCCTASSRASGPAAPRRWPRRPGRTTRPPASATVTSRAVPKVATVEKNVSSPSPVRSTSGTNSVAAVSVGEVEPATPG